MSVGKFRPIVCHQCEGVNPLACSACYGTGRVKPCQVCETTTIRNGKPCRRCNAKGFTPSKALHPRYWTPAQRGELLEKYGSASTMKTVCVATGGRTPHALKIKARREYGQGQLSMQGLHSTRAMATILGVESKTLRWWSDAFGLKFKRGPSCGKYRASMYSVDDVVAFLKQRPEFADVSKMSKRLCKNIGLSVDEVRTRYQWKVVTCTNANRHATNQPLDFWTAIHKDSMVCPACGSTCSGASVKQTYSDKHVKPANVEAYRLLTSPNAKVLASVFTGHSTTKEIAYHLFNGWGDSIKTRVQNNLHRLEEFGLIHSVRFDRVKRGECRYVYMVTNDGRDTLSQLETCHGNSNR